MFHRLLISWENCASKPYHTVAILENIIEIVQSYLIWQYEVPQQQFFHCCNLLPYLNKLFKSVAVRKSNLKFCTVASIKELRATFCKNQAAWNSDFFKNSSFLHILFLSLLIWISEIFFKSWLLIFKLWLIKVWGYFQQKLIFDWKSNFNTNHIHKPA